MSDNDLECRARSFIERIRPHEGIFVAGKWLPSRTGTFAVEDPATCETVALVAEGGVVEATAAVDAAFNSFAPWSGLAPRTRSELLACVRELMLRDIDDLAALISLENGKPVLDARAEVAYAAEFFRWFAEEMMRPCGDFGASPDGSARTIVTHKPVGVAALVTPWNFPAAMVTRKVAPALAAGCTVVVKPPAETPLTALAIARLLIEAGIPDGVVNVVPGLDAPRIVSTWLEDPRVRKLSFTGSTNVGRVLLRQAADRVVNSSMELGGNAPFIVTSDADLNAAVEGAMIAKFRNGGQACTAANRFYIHESVAGEFARLMGARVKELRVGPATDGSDIGPLISQRAVDNLANLVDAAIRSGARIVQSARPTTASGHFFSPVVLADVPPDAAVVAQEAFGPVAPIVTWSDLDSLIEMVNESEFGLAGYVYAGDRGEAIRIGERLEVGMVGVNRGLVSDPAAPFGGVKQSGLGREGAHDGLAEFQETQYLSVAW